jgi:8-oxo-dGTP pyrophosphatase MutT (NUDIX family)
LAFDLPRNRVVSAEELDIRLDPAPHPFELAHAEPIEANWRSEVARNPALFDGTIVLLSELAYAGGRLTGRCHAVRYATLLHWRRSDRSGGAAEHAFAHAALVSSDNALVAIRMAAHTANAGKVYFAAGSFEPSDFRDGQADLDYNMRREVGEETGLDIGPLRREAGFRLFSANGGTVIFRRYFLDETAEAIARRITGFVAAQAESEIDGPVIIRDADVLPEGTMPHMAAIVRWHFSPES